ncbi:MAG TPA: 3,4-dihydroxy-2-butanone-4-phosphate synthase [Terriglobia bacterium]|jgi:3,4-dihydroxy 2-butanone 4-phosphate synthase/GTP cyclohydrolase II|nr:3,4-dihydroxy-2-butanone-4-phosphate synthase [Terriglobia bacterium]
MRFATIEEALLDIQDGRKVIIVDDEDRENEGDLMVAADKITPEAINFMATHGRGLICLAMTGQRLDDLNIPLMVSDSANSSPHGTAFCVSIEARRGVSTGISVHDRAQTILTAIDAKTRPSDLSRPGHIFPLRARDGGVLVRAGQTEASVDLARIAGLFPAGVICEIMKEDGTMARVPDLLEFSERHDVKMITVADLIRYRLKTESFVRNVGERILTTPHGDFRIIGFQSILGNETHYALVKGDIGSGEDVLVRVHTQCLVGDVFGSVTCHCHQQMDRALDIIAAEGRGVLLYLAQMSKAGQTNLIPEIDTHGKKGIDANETIAFRGEQREYGIGAQILASLNIHSMRILSNHPRKLIALKAYGLQILTQVPFTYVKSTR